MSPLWLLNVGDYSSVFQRIDLPILGDSGEYIGQMFAEVKARPSFIIERTINLKSTANSMSGIETLLNLKKFHGERVAPVCDCGPFFDAMATPSAPPSD
jgi:hypothetical protein